MSGLKTPSKLTLEEVRTERLRATREYLDLLEERERELTSAAVDAPASNKEIAPDPRLVKWPLPDAIVAYLASCDQPQAVKQIAAALKGAGREFDTDKPVRSVQTALKKAMTHNNDVVHVAHAKYHLRSKYRKGKLEKLAAKDAGTGGRSKKEHAKLTSDGIKKRRAEGLPGGDRPRKQHQK